MPTKTNPPPRSPCEYCRRSTERRRFSLATVRMAIHHGKRHHGRRAGDQWGHYVDRYEPHLLYVALAILVLSGIDAMLTLNLLPLGAREVNPFMAFLMDIDLGLFTLVKMSITAIGLVVLVVHVKFRLFRILRTSAVLYGILPMYVFLVAYELTLLATYG